MGDSARCSTATRSHLPSPNLLPRATAPSQTFHRDHPLGQPAPTLHLPFPPSPDHIFPAFLFIPPSLSPFLPPATRAAAP
eukprot:1436315-Rhodomonas_salina.1